MATCQSQVREEFANERIMRLLLHQTEVEDELEQEYHLMDELYDLELVPLHIKATPVQSPPAVAPEVAKQVDHSASVGSSWQTATSRRFARALRCTAPVISHMSVAAHDDVIINPSPASVVTSSISVVEDSIPASAASPLSTVDNNPSVGLPISVVDSTSALSNPSSDVNPAPVVNPASVVESSILVNPITGLLTSLTAQQQQGTAQATVDDVTGRTLSQTLNSNRSMNVPLFSDPAIAQTKLLKNIAQETERDY